MLVLDRQCERLLRRGRSTLIRHSNVPSDRQLRASNGSDALSRHRSSLQRAQPIAPHHHRLRGQIAIERAAPSVPHLPRLRALQVCRRRPLVCVAASVMAGIRKPLHDLPVRLRRTRVSLTSQQLPKSLRRNGARRQCCGRGSDEQNAPQDEASGCGRVLSLNEALRDSTHQIVIEWVDSPAPNGRGRFRD